MEWLKKILEGAVITDGVLSIDSTVDAIKKEVPKHLIPKDVYNDLKGKYDTANNDLIELRNRRSRKIYRGIWRSGVGAV